MTKAVGEGLSARSTVKYYVMLHGIFKLALRDRVIPYNPCSETELPKVVARKTRTLTPEEFQRLLTAIPDRSKVLVLTEIETGLSWGELIAPRPRHVDFLRRTITVEETIVEVSKRISPTGERMIVKPCPKDDEPRTLGVRESLLDALAARIGELRLDGDDLIFPSTETAGGRPRGAHPCPATRSHPRVAAGGREGEDRLRGAHARPAICPRPLAPGWRSRTQRGHDRMGHAQIQTTQKYLHSLPDTAQKNLDAFERILRIRQD